MLWVPRWDPPTPCGTRTCHRAAVGPACPIPRALSPRGSREQVAGRLSAGSHGLRRAEAIAWASECPSSTVAAMLSAPADAPTRLLFALISLAILHLLLHLNEPCCTAYIRVGRFPSFFGDEVECLYRPHFPEQQTEDQGASPELHRWEGPSSTAARADAPWQPRRALLSEVLAGVEGPLTDVTEAKVGG